MSILALAGLTALVAAVVQALVMLNVIPERWRTLALAIGSIVVFAVEVLGEYFGWDLDTINKLAEMIAQLILMLLGTWFSGIAVKVWVRELRKSGVNGRILPE